MRQVHWLTGRPGRIGLRLWVDARQRQRLIQLVAVDAVIVERVATTTMRQRQFCCRPDILLLNGADTTPGGVRGGGPGHYQIGPHAVHVERRAQRSDAPQLVVAQHHIVYRGPGRGNPVGQLRVGVGIACDERIRVGFVGHPPADDLYPHVDVT